MKQAARAVHFLFAAGLGLGYGRKTAQTAGTVDVKPKSDCFDYQCSDGWVPLNDHHERNGTSDAECCKETCKLWKCTGDYVRNPAYHKNIGTSNAQCCDLSCTALTCPEGQKVPDHKQDSAGLNSSECCVDTCIRRDCDLLWVHIPEKKGDIPPAGEVNSYCCQKTCAAYTCDHFHGLTYKPGTAKLTSVSDKACCTPTCETLNCPKGYSMPSSKRYEVAEGNPMCCQPTCERHTCSPGWVPNSDKRTTISQRDEECCIKTCNIWSCNDGWAPNPDAAGYINVDDPTCCLKKCVQHQDKCTGDWAPNGARNNTVGQTHEACCKETCAFHRCTRGIPIRDPQSVASQQEDDCCEDERCPLFRNKTARSQGCNGLSKEECLMSYMTLNNTVTGATDVLSCTWEEDLRLCGLSGEKEPDPAGCNK